MNTAKNTAIPTYRKVQLGALGFVAVLQSALLSTSPEIVDAKILTYAFGLVIIAEALHRLMEAVEFLAGGLKKEAKPAKKQQRKPKQEKKADKDDIPDDPVRPSVRTVQKPLLKDAPVRPANIPADYVLVNDPIYGQIWSKPKK